MLFLDSSVPEEVEDIFIGSIRYLMDVNEALQHGAHIVTVPSPILHKMLWNPRTESTIREFNAAWDARRKD